MIRWHPFLLTILVLSLSGDSVLALGAEPQNAPVAIGPAPSPPDPEEVRSVVADVMSAPEYRHLIRSKQKEDEDHSPGWFERLLDRLFGSAKGGELNMPSLSWVAMLLRGLAYLVAVAILALLAAVIVRGIWNRVPNRSRQVERGRPEDLALMTPPGELPSDEYVRRAMEYAAADDHKAAIRELLLGTMSWIERAGLIRFRRGLSNRDYLRAVGRRRPACRDSMSAIVDAFDRTYFGRRAATADVFENCLELYRRGFPANETIALAS